MCVWALCVRAHVCFLREQSQSAVLYPTVFVLTKHLWHVNKISHILSDHLSASRHATIRSFGRICVKRSKKQTCFQAAEQRKGVSFSVSIGLAGTCNVRHSLPSMMHYSFLMMEPQ